MKICPICKKKFDAWGHNPWPITSMIESYVGGECCDNCNEEIVIPARLVIDKFKVIFDKVAVARNA